MKEHVLQTGEKNTILRNVSAKVTEFSEKLVILEKDMLKIMKEEEGVGIAAPQVGENIRMVICMFNNIKHTTLINPTIVWRSDEIVMAEEGCLSLPGIRAKVKRNKKVIVEYQDLKGKMLKRSLNGFPARVLQHEMDHIDGVLFIDRVEDKQAMKYAKNTSL